MNNSAGTHVDEMDGVTMTGHEIYRRIHAGPGAISIMAASDAAAELARRYEHRTARIIALSGTMTAAWQGSASDVAQFHMPALVRLHQDAQKVLETVRTALGQQAGHYGETRRKLENIPETKPVNRMYNPDELAADIAQAAADYNAKAHHNIVVYDQYVAQSYANGRAMGDTSYPVVSATPVPSITVREWAGPEASRTGIGPAFRSSAGTSPTGDVRGVTMPPGEEGPGVPPEGGPGAVPPTGPVAPEGSDAASPPSLTGPVTAQQGWGPDPSLARNWIADGAAAGNQSPLPAVKEPDGHGSAVPGGTGRNPTLPDRDGRGAGVGSRHGAGKPVVSRSVLRGSFSAGAGISDQGSGMVAAPLSPGGDDDTEHRSKLGDYVDLDALFAVDEPPFPSVIGAEHEEEEAER